MGCPHPQLWMKKAHQVAGLSLAVLNEPRHWPLGVFQDRAPLHFLNAT